MQKGQGRIPLQEPVHNRLEMIVHLSTKTLDETLQDMSPSTLTSTQTHVCTSQSSSPCPADEIKPSTIHCPSDKRLSGMSRVFLRFPNTPNIYLCPMAILEYLWCMCPKTRTGGCFRWASAASPTRIGNGARAQDIWPTNVSMKYRWLGVQYLTDSVDTSQWSL